MLVDIGLEMKDISPQYSEVPYAFIGCPAILNEGLLNKTLLDSGVDAANLAEVESPSVVRLHWHSCCAGLGAVLILLPIRHQEDE